MTTQEFASVYFKSDTDAGLAAARRTWWLLWKPQHFYGLLTAVRRKIYSVKG